MIKISNIERFSTHDGPGIRTTIFLKGCPLHCPWCANPETWSLSSVLMHNERKCVSCQKCSSVCQQKAISFLPEFHLNQKKCIACGECTKFCIPGALSLSGEEKGIDEIIKEVKKDDDYYEASQGGVTVSGGEPFFQEEIILLLQKLKKEGYHIAAETTGNYSIQRLQEVEPYIDLFLFDVKHVDHEVLKKVTGADLNIILNNLNYLANNCPEKVIIRTPVIPTFNYEDTILKRIMHLTKEFGFREINLLPYHSLGKNKWKDIQKTYAFENEKMMDKKELMDYKKYGEAIGLKVKIGG